jgi:probable F420-dependent oxidoreductase
VPAGPDADRVGGVEISVQATPRDASSWLDLARRCETLGVRALLVSDHPGAGPSPFVALAAAAAVTTTLRLGSCVVNAGVRDPLLLAQDVATLDVVSGGRAELGIGAGHTPAEWEMTGSRRPSAAARVDRLLEVAARTSTLLDGGTVAGEFGDVVLRSPRPVQDHVPLTVAGGHPRLLAWAGAHADVVGISGLGRTLADGHSHTVRWSPAEVEETIARTGRRRPVEALVQRVVRREELDDVARETGVRAAELLAAPYVWVGSAVEIRQELQACAERWGITRWVVREAALDTVAELLG